MKVNAGKQINKQPTAKEISRAEVEAKLKAKFGKIPTRKKREVKIEEKVELKTGPLSPAEEKAEKKVLTGERLKNILKNGGFQFSEAERKALGSILK